MLSFTINSIIILLGDKTTRLKEELILMRININEDSFTGKHLIALSDQLGISPTKVILKLIDDNSYYAHIGDADNGKGKEDRKTNKECL